MRYILNISVALLLTFTHANDAFAMDDPGLRAPSKYAVHQQQGPVCPYLPWINLQKLRAIRVRENGLIQFQEEDYTTKLQSYAFFLPQMRVLDHMYEGLRARKQHYAVYEEKVRLEGIRSDHIFDGRGNFVDNMDWLPTNKARREFYTPFNINVKADPYKMGRWLPILFKPGTDNLYFFDYRTNKTPQIEQPGNDYDDTKDVYIYQCTSAGVELKRFRFTQAMLDKMGVTIAELGKTYVTQNFLGFNQGNFILAYADEVMNKETFYDVGTYQHMLFACGLKSDNTLFADNDDSIDAKAYREYHQALMANPLNPWATLNKEDLFEYHLAVIFKTNPVLKAKAKESVNFYNDAWKYHSESFDLYDNPKGPKTKLSEKQRFMPGEDQMLAYYFSHELRTVWASSISMAALSATLELEEYVGKTAVSVMKVIGMDEKSIIKKALEQQYGSKGQKYSFLDTWDEIKQLLPKDKKDMVSFSSHGSVISFDEVLIAMQSHENRPVAQRLGFEMLDSYYDQGLNPFYRKAGTAKDRIQFDE